MQTGEPELKGLMLAALDGNAFAYRALLGDLRLRLTGYLGRRLRQAPDDVEDLVQDTLIAIHDRRATWDRSQPLLPWVYAIARYRLIDHYRRTGRRVHVPLDDVDAELSVADESAAVDARRDVEIALAQLPERTQTLVRRLKLEAQSVADTAVQLDMSEGAVKVALHRGLKAMGVRLGVREKEHE